MAQETDRAVHEHFVRGLGESTRHNSLAFGYSLALTGSYGVISTLVHETNVFHIFLFGIGGAATFSIANPAVTRMFKYPVASAGSFVLARGIQAMIGRDKLKER
jgi:hypothetical protein